MSTVVHEPDTIGASVMPVDTWNPLSASADREFEYIDIASIDREAKLIASTTRLTAGNAPSRARQIVRSRDVLVSTVRPNLNAVALVPSTLDGAIASTGFCILRCQPNRLDYRYLFHWVRTPQFIAKMVKVATGASYPAVSDRIIRESEIPLPPLAEQKRIADILDKADAIRHKRQHVLREVLELPRRLFFEMFGNVVLNDRGWCHKSVGEVGEVQLGRQRSPKYQSGKFTRPYIRVANVFDDRIDLSDVLTMDFDERDYAAYRLEYGDILLNEGQSTELVGRPAIWRNELPDCCFQNTLVRFRADDRETNSEFALAVFREYLHRGAFARISSKTSSVAHLGAARFAAMPFPLPPRKAQEQFASVRQQLRETAATVQASYKDSYDLFCSLVDCAFRGEL